MRHFSNLDSLEDFQSTIDLALQLKKDPFAFETLGKRKTIALVFFNNSLRTRLSTEKAARNLGMEVMVLNVSDSWNLEFGDGTVMNMDTAEHIKEATQVIAQYADIIAVRAFAGLVDKAADQQERVLNAFMKYTRVPIVNMESALSHPLQGLTDAITIKENIKKPKPKVVLSWAPHPKALPHAVANSFVKSMKLSDVELVITNPEGYDLDPEITSGIPIIHDQKEALKNADIVYVKNWSSFENYGQVDNKDENWMMTKEKLGKAIFMHCLPVRRNVVVEDAVLDSEQSVVIEQAGNRTYAAQAVLKLLLSSTSTNVVIAFLVTVFLLTSCNENKSQSIANELKTESIDSLQFIDRWNQIELIQTDDHYGEWGGDTDVILVYSDGQDIYIDYSRYLGSHGPPMPPKPGEKILKWYEYKELESDVDSIKLGVDEIRQVENSIIELVKEKIYNRTYPAHSGFVSSVISRDSSLIIDQYPSSKWNSFQKLKEKIISRSDQN